MTSHPSNDFLKWIEPGVIVILLISMFYTAGWSFAYHYFEYFHLGLVGLDIPKEYLLMYSYWAAKANFFWVVLLLFLMGGGHFLFRFVIGKKIQTLTASGSPRSDIWLNLFQIGLVLLTVLVILLMFWMFYWFGYRAADKTYAEQTSQDFPSYPRVRVWVSTENKKDISSGIIQEWQKGCYRLLLRNKDNLYLFYWGGDGEKTPTDIVPINKVVAVRVLPLYKGCKE